MIVADFFGLEVVFGSDEGLLWLEKIEFDVLLFSGCYEFFSLKIPPFSLNLASLFIERMMNAMIHWTILWTE
jgi:hypothetical protein